MVSFIHCVPYLTSFRKVCLRSCNKENNEWSGKHFVSFAWGQWEESQHKQNETCSGQVERLSVGERGWEGRMGWRRKMLQNFASGLVGGGYYRVHGLVGWERRMIRGDPVLTGGREFRVFFNLQRLYFDEEQVDSILPCVYHLIHLQETQTYQTLAQAQQSQDEKAAYFANCICNQ